MYVNEEISTLVAKKLEGRASVEEQEQLQQWLDADAGHPAEFAQLTRIWEESQHLAGLPAFNAELAWKRLYGRIRTLVRPVAFYWRRMAIAAAVAGIVVAAWWLRSANSPRWEQLEATTVNQLVQLPDGSSVLLRKGSKIAYPRTFDQDKRLVRLTGEALFSVQPNEHRPFQVAVAHTRIDVLGTTFLVRSRNAADEVVVTSGKVRVTGNSPLAGEVVLTAGQKAVLQAGRFNETPVTDSNYMAWKTGLLEFKGASLQKVLEDIEDYYDVPLSLAPGQGTVGNAGITARFDNYTFNQVLEELQLLTGMKAKKENGKIYLYYQK